MGYYFEKIDKDLVKINTGFKKSDIGKYLVQYDEGGSTIMTPLQVKKFKANKLSYDDFDWEED